MADHSHRRDNAATATMKTLPNFEIDRLRHLLTLPAEASVDTAQVKKSLLEHIVKNEMYPYLERLREQMPLMCDVPAMEDLREVNAKTLAELDEKIEFAQKNFGSSEVKDAVLEKANYYLKIGDHERAVSQYESALSQTVGVNSKLEIVLCLLRVAFFFNDVPLLMKYMERAKKDIENRGDWEIRNRLHIYESLQLIICRKFKPAAELLLNSLSTFTATELITLEELVLYTVVLSLITMDRPTIRSKLLESAEVAQVASEGSALHHLIHDFYHCNYKNFMMSLVRTSELVLRDRYMARYCNYFLRQARLPAYRQFLRPYKSVTIENMAHAFQLPAEFLERELVSYISGMRLDCKIDLVNGIIENSIMDDRNTNYIEIVKEGDLLINRIQKLSRIFDM
ncbi:PCI domain containing 26S proteasome non-ATPase regulatory subunit 6 protein, putative [Babesia bigemina]|uniref:PCI domain containing 26S proteasome non-ATPase regulatory subunit 6 protein, putative n=1 Tax=Babesia bigemina TaxID=5866 RepID=A0A061D7X6_BABBI|nr:PCI domain containing 26S proteasome non-ATPase regulatory subunit 6 protein, putative [Babesia bigemina]CDR95024.1 PCI domain containing 26S proteasome non-ATPase regulatory subunit 6 protein, putative [Babesia bigemina]|eukprot:XP_012767210.1 PCI domain containing 26S proteasome non-ATPase regulatory subunit 6 protein, putative [Babesia bigemina]